MQREKLTICFFGNIESVHMRKWVNYFSNYGHHVHLFSYKGQNKNYWKTNFKFHIIRKKIPIQIWPLNTLLNLPFIFFEIRKLIKEIKPDIIHAHYVTSYGTLAVLLGFHPLVITAWGSDILLTPQKFLPSKWAIKWALKKTDLITCDASHMKEAMIKLGAEESKIKIINFGIDTKKFSPGKKDEKLKKELGLAHYKIVISLRSLEPIYDIETLIKSVPAILQEISETKFIIAGTGSQEEELKRLSENLGVRENVKFLGQVPNEELPKYLRIADIYVSTSLSDGGIASSTAEAMACGLPVIITDTGDNKSWVRNEGNGFLIPIKNPKILAEKTIFLLKNETLGKEFGKENRKIIEERNDYYKEMAKMEELYLNLVGNKEN